MEENQEKQPIDLEPEVVFNTMSDLQSFSVQSEETHEVLMEIVGYGLRVRYNREKIKNIADVESLLDGIKELYRKMIMEDMFTNQQ